MKIRPHKLNPRFEQRQQEWQRVENSKSLAEAFPKLKSLSVVLAYFDTSRMMGAGELRYRANIQHAKSILTFSCPNAACSGGGFDLSEILERAIKGKQKTVQGELECRGTRTFMHKDGTLCKHLLRYKLALSYQGRASALKNA